MRLELINAIEKYLSGIDDRSSQNYEQCSKRMLDLVNRELEQKNKLGGPTWPNGIEVVRANRTNHAEFMISAFRVKGAATFVDAIVGVCRSYAAYDFDPDYFQTELAAWAGAIRKCMSPREAMPVLNLYDFMIRRHQDILALANKPVCVVTPKLDAAEYCEMYLAAVLKPSGAEAMSLARAHISSLEDMCYWWSEVLRPAMYKVGELWAKSDITVGQEHLAASITQRVMAAFYPMVLELPRDKGDVVLTTSPGEHHEIGLRMISDFLEIHGWNVYYIGADTPIKSVIDLLKRHSVRLLCVSTTMPLNLIHTRELVEAVHSEIEGEVGVLVGGQAYCADPSVWEGVGAEGFADSIEEAVSFLDKRATKT